MTHRPASGVTVDLEGRRALVTGAASDGASLPIDGGWTAR